MHNQFIRTEMLLGKAAMERLSKSKVAVFGVGGVGSFCVEALARSGVYQLDIFDGDTVALSNLNRQLIATRNTLGRPKVDVMKERILEINPDAVVNAYNLFYTADTEIELTQYSYIVDCIDTVTSKLTLIEKAFKADVPIICSMGAGNKLDPTAFEVADISKTSVCPLAKVIRKELKERGITSIKVVYSKEMPLKPGECAEQSSKRQTPGSVAFVPSVVGMILAGEVIKEISLLD